MSKKIAAELLEILVCPKCLGTLKYDEANQELICETDQLAYQIQNGIPNMLINEARKINDQK